MNDRNSLKILLLIGRTAARDASTGSSSAPDVSSECCRHDSPKVSHTLAHAHWTCVCVCASVCPRPRAMHRMRLQRRTQDGSTLPARGITALARDFVTRTSRTRRLPRPLKRNPCKFGCVVADASPHSTCPQTIKVFAITTATRNANVLGYSERVGFRVYPHGQPAP